jgi:hypothetical protein
VGVLQSLLTTAASNLSGLRPLIQASDLPIANSVLSNLSTLFTSLPANDRFNAATARAVASSLYSLFNGGLNGIDLGALENRFSPPAGPFSPPSRTTMYDQVCDLLGRVMQSARDQS